MSAANAYNPVDVSKINAADWSYKLGEIGQVVTGLDDINQCIRIIITTPKGSVPHRPEFGADTLPYLDLPISEAIPGLIQAMWEGIERWEPRAIINKITPNYDPANMAQLWMTVYWTVTLGSPNLQTTTVPYALSQLA